MMKKDHLAQTLLAISQALDRENVRWAVGGSFASSTYGEYRTTNDVDVIAALSEKQARSFISSLSEDFYAPLEVAVDAVRRRSSFNVIDDRTSIKVDVFVPAAGPLGIGQLDRVRNIEMIEGLRQFPVLGPEDVVLQKLHWYRLGGGVSERQWRDICSIFSSGRELDHSYLDAVAGREDLTALLDRARSDSSGNKPGF